MRLHLLVVLSMACSSADPDPAVEITPDTAVGTDIAVGGDHDTVLGVDAAVDVDSPTPGPCTSLAALGGEPKKGSTLEGLCALAPLDDGSEAKVGLPVIVAPSDALPPEVVSQNAHNNLDAEWHEGRLFLAFRTAPTHFASPDVEMYVVSTADLDEWRFEGKFALGTDVREPQLVSFAGQLHLFFAVLGEDPLSFTPLGNRRAKYLSPGKWTKLESAFADDFIPWRIRAMEDHVEVIGYTGGANIYENDGQPIRVRWLTSTDGVAFEPLLPGHEVILEGGTSETDIATLDDGGIVLVSRNEAGDAEGFGSLICRAPKTDHSDLECAHDKRKYDSPLVFKSGSQVYLLGRRNVTESGNYDLDQDQKSLADQYTAYQLAYWGEPKRCTLWKVDSEALAVNAVVDLPSRGDTCFPEAIPLRPGVFLVFNYTSPLDGEDDPSWITAQTGKTQIVYTTLQLPGSP